MERIEQQLQTYLAPGERVLWTGRPAQGIAFQVYDLFLVPFSFVWAGLALTAFFAQPVKPVPFPFWAVKWLFVVVALYITVGRFAIDWWIRAHVIYAVTDNRVMIVSTGFGTAVKSFGRGQNPSMHLVEGGNRIGSIRFRDDGYMRYGAFHHSNATSSLFRIADAKAVFDLIRKSEVVQPR